MRVRRVTTGFQLQDKVVDSLQNPVQRRVTLRNTRRPYKSSTLPLPIGVPVTHHLVPSRGRVSSSTTTATGQSKTLDNGESGRRRGERMKRAVGRHGESALHLDARW